MGQAPVSGIVPAKGEIKWKTGTKAEALPSPVASQVTTLEKLAKNSGFKDFLCEHIDSDYLVTSLLTVEAKDPIKLLNGIRAFENLDDDSRAKILDQLSNYKSISSAGFEVNVYLRFIWFAFFIFDIFCSFHVHFS